MQTIFIWILRFGLIELFSIFFVLVNLLTFVLFVMERPWRVSGRLLCFLTLACGGFGALLGLWVAGRNTRRRRVGVVGVLGVMIALIPMVHIAHALTLDRMVHYMEVEFRSQQWPAELDGYRIAFLTDLHNIPDEDMAAVARELNRRDLDLLLLGGDFSMRHAHYQGTVRELAQIHTTDGIFGVEGNHDDYSRLFAAKEAHGITPLDNTGVRIQDGFFLAGVQDLWNRNPNVSTAIAGAHAHDFILLLSHNPDVTMAQSTAHVGLTLSGHTHGGQITLFGFPMYLLRGSITDHGTHFAHGFAQSADGTPVFTSRGIGPYYNTPRIFARPEVVIFTMYYG